MNDRRRIIKLLGMAGFALSPLPALAQKPQKMLRIGYLNVASRQSQIDNGRYAALLKGLQDRGYVKDANFALEERYVDGDLDRLPAAAAELVQQKVDVIVTTATQASVAAQKATSTIPIVIAVETDPVGSGFAKTLARPGGNMTGLSTMATDTVTKHLNLLAEVKPGLKRLGVLMDPLHPAHPGMLKSLEGPARRLKIALEVVRATSPAEIERALSTLKDKRAEGVLVLIDSVYSLNRRQIAEQAAKLKLMSIYPDSSYAEAGGFMTYGVVFNDNFHRVGGFIDRIAKGANPAEMPFEQPTKFELVINHKATSAVGITVPRSLLARADRLID